MSGTAHTINRFDFDCTIDDGKVSESDTHTITVHLGEDNGGDVTLPYPVFSECVRDSSSSETFVEKVLAAKEMEASNAQGPISKRHSVPASE